MAQQSSEQTTSSTIMAAPKEEILRVIADFEQYPQWADAVREAEVVQIGENGRPACVRFVLDAGVLKDEYVLGYDWEDETTVRWHLVEQGSVLSGMRGAYHLREVPDGTEVIYELAVDVKFPMIGMFKRKAERTIIDTALRELKRHVEG